jgi:hypothetical protein
LILQILHRAFKKPKRAAPLESFEDEELRAARALLAEETALLKLSAELEHGQDTTAPSVLATLKTIAADTVYLPSVSDLIPNSSATSGNHVESLRGEFDTIASAYARDAARLAKLEQRIGVLLKGYEIRANKVEVAVSTLAAEELNKTIEYACYVRLAHDEAVALPARLSAVSGALAEAGATESQLQARYRNLVAEITDLRKLLASAGVTV